MSGRDNNEEARRYLDRLFDFLAEPPEDMELVRESLIQDGVDVNAFLDKTRKLIEQLKEADRLGWKKEAQREKEKAAYFLTSVTKYLNLNRAELEDKFYRLTAGGPQLASAQFRNLEKLTDDDLRTVISELEALKQSQEKSDA